jgi:hypothetical protein
MSWKNKVIREPDVLGHNYNPSGQQDGKLEASLDHIVRKKVREEWGEGG